MDLFLVPNNPEHTVLVSPNGVAHYQVSTTKTSHGRRVTTIQRPAESVEASVVAEVDWGNFENPTVVRRCPLVRGRSLLPDEGVLASDFLYKKYQFSSSRYFLGDDAIEYRWKFIKGVGCVLIRVDTKEEIARYSFALSKEGLYAGERKSRLNIQPCSVELDLIVVSFLIMLKKKREKSGGDHLYCAHDEDPQGDGGGDGGG
ncbi:hypothetical protein GYMLUDRAFT_48696 [Collybiopsis luxurians FD-317 M1]|uniref:DUF6593 domain-containing protein n=1 Tax=Collybiopsis luxurians FD-317 M1 TaxID=944289 RepID=A0A0D0AVN2_9AGAR|nr:hypothetical protein GYMLUDRAFT_48696 [Collybiopsis luxurians FD-317 M1]